LGYEKLREKCTELPWWLVIPAGGGVAAIAIGSFWLGRRSKPSPEGLVYKTSNSSKSPIVQLSYQNLLTGSFVNCPFWLKRITITLNAIPITKCLLLVAPTKLLNQLLENNPTTLFPTFLTVENVDLCLFILLSFKKYCLHRRKSAK
jgi:hypothetical protein